jgi:hypothetical protein
MCVWQTMWFFMGNLCEKDKLESLKEVILEGFHHQK